jgi:hypothetical protein
VDQITQAYTDYSNGVFAPNNSTSLSTMNKIDFADADNIGSVAMAFIKAGTTASISALGAAFSDADQLLKEFETTTLGSSPSSVRTAAVAVGTVVDQFMIHDGYYIPQAADANGSGGVSNNIAGSIVTKYGLSGGFDVATLERINVPFADASFAVGGLVHVPFANPITVTSGTDVHLPPLFGETYVYDPSSSKVFVVGSSIDGHDSGALIIDTPVFGGFATFAKGTYSGFTLQANGNVAIDLTTSAGDALGTLSFNPSSDAGTLTLPGLPADFATTGMSIPISVSSAAHLVASTGSAEQALLGDLSALGDPLTAAQLDQQEFNYLNPVGTPSTLSGTVTNPNNTYATLTFTVVGGSAGGLTITGQNTVVVSNGSSNLTLPVTNNILNTDGQAGGPVDLSRDTISNIQTLACNDAVGTIILTQSELGSFNAITVGAGMQGGTFVAATGGTYSLNIASINSTASFNLTAADWSGTTLIGNNGGNEQLTASQFGNDTLTAGNGAGDWLVAGEGVDTLTGGTGGDTFYAVNGLAAGSVLQGNGSNNTLYAWGDISSATVSGIQRLYAGEQGFFNDGTLGLTLTAAQFNAFSFVLAQNLPTYAASAGTYSLNNVTNSINLVATSTGGTTLDGSGSAYGYETLTASATGNDTLKASNFNNDTLIAGGGVDTLIGGTGNNQIFVANNGLAAGSVINATNHPAGYFETLQAAGDISGASISGITNLNLTGDITLTASQLSSFTNGLFEAGVNATPSTIFAATGGVYNVLFSYSRVNPFNMVALSSAGTTLEEGAVSNITLTASSSGNDTLISYGSSNITLDAEFSTGNDNLYAAESISGTSSGGNGDSSVTMLVGQGNDNLYGGGGNTIYDFGTSFGQDVINHAYGLGASGSYGAINFASGITLENLWFTQSGNNLIIRLLGTNDTITVQNWFGSVVAEVQTINAGGLTLLNTSVSALVSAMATYQAAHSSFNPATATSMPTSTTLQTALTSAWSAASVAGAMANQSTLDSIVGGYKVVDTGTNVAANLAFLASDVSHIASIILTDILAPTLSLTGSQVTSDVSVLNKLISGYNLSLSGGGTFTMGSFTNNIDTVTLQAAPSGQTQPAFNVTSTVGDLTIVDSGSGDSVTITGSSPDTVNMNGSNDTLTDSSTATNTINVNATGALIYGDNDTINAAANVIISDGYGGNIVNLNNAGGTTFYDGGSSGETINISGNGSNDDYVSASSSTITFQNNARADTYGSHNTISAGSGDIVGSYNGTNNAVTIGSNSSAWLGSGSSNTINVNGSSGGSNVYDSDTSGDTVNVSGNGTSGTSDGIHIASGTVGIASNANAYIVGNSNTITAGSNDTVGIYGTTNTLTIGTAGTVNMGTSGGNTINITGAGNSAVYDSSSTGDAVNVSNTSNGANDDYINLSNGSVVYQSGARADIFGNSNTVTASLNDTVGVDGTGNAATIGNGSNIWLWYGTNAHDTVNVTASNGGDNVYDSDTSDTVNVSGNGTSGTSDGIHIASGTVAISSSANAYIVGNSNTITAGSNDTVGIYGSANTLTIGAAGTVNMGTSGGNTINVTGAGNSNVYDSSSTGDTVNISGNGQWGTDNYISLSSGTAVLQSNARVDIYGSNDTITAGATDAFGVHGSNDTVTMGANTDLWLDPSTSDTNDVLNGGGSDQYNFASTFGNYTINNGGGTTANGSISFGSSVTDENLWFKKSGNNLLIDLLGTTDQITVNGWFTSGAAGNQVADIYAGSLTLDTQVAQLVSAMASYASAHSGFNPQTATAMPTDTTLQSAITAAWHT